MSGLIAAGAAKSPKETQAQEVWEILTGAPVPAGLDTVVPLERVTQLAGPDGAVATIMLSAPLQTGQNIRQIGEDFVRGQVVVAAGTRLAPHHVMGLAACGVDAVPVVAPPRVAVLTTGAELATQGADLAAGADT